MREMNQLGGVSVVGGSMGPALSALGMHAQSTDSSRPVGAVEREFYQLRDAIREHGNVLSRLLSRLESAGVLRNVPPQAATEPEPCDQLVPVCGAAVNINLLVLDVAGMSGPVRDALDRLEL